MNLPPMIGECKPIIAEYLRCLRRVKGINDAECRIMAKDYLKCRMDQYVIFFIFFIFYSSSARGGEGRIGGSPCVWFWGSSGE